MRARHPMLISLCVCAITLAGACTDAVSPNTALPKLDSPATVVRTVTLTPSEATLATGTHLTVQASLTDASGQPVTLPINWSSSDSTVATVSPSGSVEAVAPGRAVIMASANGAYATAPVTVTKAAPADSIAITPSNAKVIVGQTLQFGAAVRDSALTQGVSWESSNTQVASVNSSGLVTGIAAGIASIRVTWQGRTAAAAVTVLIPDSVTVTPPANIVVQPSTVSVKVNGTAQLSVGDGGSATWTSSNPAVASVSSTGLVTGLSSGSTIVTAERNGQTGTAQVQVTADPVDVGLSSLPLLTLNTGDSVQPSGWFLEDPDHHLSVVTDASAPSPPHALQFVFPQGFHGGSGPGQFKYGTESHMLNLSQEIAVSYYFWVGPTWHSFEGVKHFYVFQERFPDRHATFVAMNGKDNGPFRLKVVSEDFDASYYPNVKNTTLVPNTWYHIQLYLKKSSSAGAPDGIVRWWVNGQLNGNYTNAKLYSDPFSEVRFDPIWESFSYLTKAATEYMRFDDVEVRGR